MKLFRVIGTALLSVALSTSVRAQSFSLNFDDAALFGAPAGGSTISGVTFSNSTFDAFFLPTSFDCTTSIVCDGVIQGTANGTLGFAFGGPVSSLSFGLVRANNLASYLALYDVNGEVISTKVLNPSALADPFFGFGGVFSWSASGTFAYSAVLSHDFDHNFIDEPFELDNLNATMATAVPEPTNVGLLAIGLVGIAVARRRRV
ncbi:PEP-CTERM sorting domain-containing protein [Gemmatimonas sp.]|jgi:hypothetical protein|uniref:PEP-CTERM sorting domain-containing protein n=1 Tax=Gemmatimonas sp. TaxID=1962908 RepID=UPI0037BE9A42